MTHMDFGDYTVRLLTVATARRYLSAALRRGWVASKIGALVLVVGESKGAIAALADDLGIPVDAYVVNEAPS